MKPISRKSYFAIIILIALSFNLTSCTLLLRNKSTAQSEVNPKKIEAIKKINEIYKNSTSNSLGIMLILDIAEKDTTNFNSYVHLANLAGEFGYHTGLLVEIAASVYHAKVETNYFEQLGDLAVMKLGDSYKISKLANKISEINTPVNAEIENEIQAMKKTADFKTIDEARTYNREKHNKK